MYYKSLILQSSSLKVIKPNWSMTYVMYQDDNHVEKY